jgi:hypothetical protein
MSRTLGTGYRLSNAKGLVYCDAYYDRPDGSLEVRARKRRRISSRSERSSGRLTSARHIGGITVAHCAEELATIR